MYIKNKFILILIQILWYIYNEIIAVHHINIDDELVFNYNKNEGTEENPFYVNDILVCGNSELDNSTSIIYWIGT